MTSEVNSKRWPTLPLQRPITKKSRYFRFKNKHTFVDALHPNVTSVYEEISNNCENCSNINKAYDCAKKIVDETNRNLSENFNKIYGRDKNIELFMKIQLQKNINSKKPILFGYYINWKKFFKFVENFPISNKITLEDKYKYILSSKYGGAYLSTDFILQLRNYQSTIAKDSFKSFKENFENATNSTIASINNTLEGLMDFLIKKLNEGKKERYSETILDFIPDVISSLDTIKTLATNGYISSCYREIRSLIERVSYVVLDEYLRINSNKFGAGDEYIIMPILNINSRWRSQQQKQEIGRIYDIIPKDVLDKIKDEKKAILDILLKKMSVEMYVALAGKPTNKDDEHTPYLEIYKIKNGIKEIREMANVQNGTLKKNLILLADELDAKWNNSTPGEFPFPTSNFVFKFLVKVFGNDLEIIKSIWNDYSLFIHPYIFTWEVIPKTSVIEYKTFEYEITTYFETAIEKLFINLFDYYDNYDNYNKSKGS
jgi:hypothetical protein